MTQKMQALVKKDGAPGLCLDAVPISNIGEFDVLIRVLRSSICGTDIHIYEWDGWAQKTIPTPMVIGHEFVGVIESVGGYVHDFHPGMIESGVGHLLLRRRRICSAYRRGTCDQ